MSSKGHRRKRKQARKRGASPMIVTMLAILLVVLAAGAALALQPRQTSPASYTLPMRVAETPEPTAAPTAVPTATPTAVPTATPTAAPTAVHTAAPTAVPTATPTAAPTQTPQVAEEAFRYLPVVKSADTSERRIAITVDDCFQVNNLKTIIETAQKVGGRLTLFPIGENIQKQGMPELLKYSVFKLGYEIENHTWSHQRIFRLPEADMAAEIWKQGQALNQALGVNYQQHFFRLMGGDGTSDQRTHNYLDQLGFKGIAYWSLSGSDASLSEIAGALAPGAIYLFHTTDADTAKLQQFIPYAASQGYQLVTMNELLGLPNNAMTEYAPQAMPQPRPYTPDLHTHKKGDYAWDIVKMQDALRSLGYLKLDGPSTGYYGQQTADAMTAFQQAQGLPATGEADAETQKRLLKL